MKGRRTQELPWSPFLRHTTNTNRPRYPGIQRNPDFPRFCPYLLLRSSYISKVDMRRSIRPSVCSVLANLVVAGLAATSDYKACYKIDGSVLPNTFRCDNRGQMESARGRALAFKTTREKASSPACFDVCSSSEYQLDCSSRRLGGSRC